MSSKNLTSSNNAANQIHLNYSIDSTEVESLLGKTFEMRGQPLQCIWLLPTLEIEIEIHLKFEIEFEIEFQIRLFDESTIRLFDE